MEVVPVIGIGLLGANVVLNHCRSVAQWWYKFVFLQEHHIRIKKRQDRLGWAQLCFELHHYMTTHRIRQGKQTIYMQIPPRPNMPAVEMRLTFPDDNYFVDVPDHGVEIEVQSEYFCVYSKRRHAADSCDRFLMLLGKEMDRHAPNGHTVPVLQGLWIDGPDDGDDGTDEKDDGDGGKNQTPDNATRGHKKTKQDEAELGLLRPPVDRDAL